ncbi:MAG: hypothetical protein LBE62_12945 [Azonexus sp.]|jgi:hypothetical protein|nr:hypothetical protein [Azonexus sp.]
MFLFTKEGRDAYLTFVRNLPSQMVLLSPCLILPKLKNFDWVAVTVCFFLGAMFLFAVIANALQIFDACKESVKKSCWGVFEYLLVILGFYGGFVAVIFMVFSAYLPKP